MNGRLILLFTSMAKQLLVCKNDLLISDNKKHITTDQDESEIDNNAQTSASVGRRRRHFRRRCDVIDASLQRRRARRGPKVVPELRRLGQGRHRVASRAGVVGD